MNITLNGTLQFLAFSIATLLATGILVFAGLNERSAEPESSPSYTTKDPR